MRTSTLLISLLLLTLSSSAQKIKVVKNTARNSTQLVDSTSGDVLREYKETRAYPGGYVVSNMDSKWGTVNEKWEEVIPCKYNDIRETKMGQSTQFIAEYGGFSNILDSAGKTIIDIQFEKVEPLNVQGLNGYRCVLSYKFGIVKSSGEVVVPFMFDDIANFHHNVARTRVENKFGYISYTGKTISQPRFEEAEELINGLGFVMENGQSYEIDVNGVLTKKDKTPRLAYNQTYLLAKEEKKEFGYVTMVDGKNMLYQLNKKLVSLFYDSIRMDPSSVRYYAYHYPRVTIYEKVGEVWTPVTIGDRIFRSIVLIYNRGTNDLTALIVDKAKWGLYYLNKKILVPAIFREHQWNEALKKYLFEYDGDWYDVTVIDPTTLRLKGTCGTCSGTGKVDGKICSKCKGIKTLQRTLVYNGVEYAEVK